MDPRCMHTCSVVALMGRNAGEDYLEAAALTWCSDQTWNRVHFVWLSWMRLLVLDRFATPKYSPQRPMGRPVPDFLQTLPFSPRISRMLSQGKQLIGFNSTAWSEFLAETPRLFIRLYFRLTRCKSVWICTFCIDCVYQNWSEHVIRFSDGLVTFAHHSHVSCPVWRKNSFHSL